MFVDDRPQGETQEQQARTLKLSEAIRIGARLVNESHATLNSCGACAIGTAFIGLGHTLNERMAKGHGFVHDTVAAECNVSPDLVAKISNRHYTVQSKSREQTGERLRIADWLEGQGL